MFEVDHDHHGSDFKRFFSPGRSSMTAIDDKRAGAFRRHVWAVTMIDEDPLLGKGSRHVADLARPGPNKLRSKRRASASGALSPAPVLPSEPTTPQLKDIPSKTETNTATAEPTMKGPMVTVQPMHPSPFGSATDPYPVREDLYPVREDSVGDFLPRTESTNALQRGLRSSFPHYSIYPGLAAPAADPTKTPDSLLVAKALNRPRKLSHGSTAPVPSMHFGESLSLSMGTGLGPRSSIGAGRRSASWGSKANFEAAESVAQWRPEYLYQRPMATSRRQVPARASLQQNEMFAMLPGEVLSLIMGKLRDLHLRPGSESCATCWMRDVCNVSLASRRWHKTARIALYDDIQLVGADLAAHKKKYKLNQGARVRMLRRSLRANPQLARLVRVLKVPAPEMPAKGSSLADYDDLIASLVMACPNLESLSGPTTGYDHSFKKIFHALSTRRNLKHMSWLIHVPPHQKHQRMHSRSRSQQQLGLVMPTELVRFQETTFLNHHHQWARLETLTIRCVPGASLAPETLLTKTLECLRSLKHLHLCNVPPSGFSDANLLALPPLQTLTLSSILGITSNGLSAFATRSNSLSLRKLHLRHTPLTSLAALARILSNLRSLVSFALIQASSPVMPDEGSFTLWMMPYLASSSIKKLHWDITAHAASVNATDDILSRSIAAGGFPALRSLRVPNDPDGLFQDLCYPVERIDLHMDRFRTPDPPAEMSRLSLDSSPTNTSPVSPTRYLFKSSSNTSLQSGPPAGSVRHPVATNLHAARLAAQARLEAAHSRPRFTVNVIEEDGTTTETFCMAGFIGTPGSEIKYHLLPDVGSTDEKGGLVAVRDLEGDGGESLAGGREGCLGRWNTRDGFMADRKEKEKWWHTERGRWTKLTL